jgi:hypothetical protein
MLARASVSSVCDLALREMRAIVIIYHDITAENQGHECVGKFKQQSPTVIDLGLILYHFLFTPLDYVLIMFQKG